MALVYWYDVRNEKRLKRDKVNGADQRGMRD